MIEATAETFDGLVEEGVVLLDFYAPWCRPCLALSPILEQIEGAKVVKVNIDQEQELAKRFDVSSIPKLVVLKDGVSVSTMVGLRSKEVLQQAVNEAAAG